MSIRPLRATGLGAALLALAAACPAAAATATWSQVGYNAGHTGFNSTETIINSKNVRKLRDVHIFNGTSLSYQPVISDDIMYVLSQAQNLDAWKLAGRKLLWSIPLATIDGPNGMAIGHDILVANCALQGGDGICAIGAKSRKSLWSFGLQNGVDFTPPTISGHLVVYGQSGTYGNSTGDNMVGVLLETGVQYWNFGPCSNGICQGLGGFAPAVDNGKVYFGCTGGAGDEVTVTGVCAVDESTGALVWQSQLGVTSAGDGQGRLIAHGGRVYVAYQTANCNQCSYTIDVAALNGETGAIVWDTPLTGQLVDSYGPVGAPALGPNDTVYESISTSNDANQPNLFALNRDGTLQWSESTAQSLANPPTIVGKGRLGLLFFGCSSAGNSDSTCAISSHTGAFAWEAVDGGYASGDFSPVVTGGTVYNACLADNICSYRP